MSETWEEEEGGGRGLWEGVHRHAHDKGRSYSEGREKRRMVGRGSNDGAHTVEKQ